MISDEELEASVAEIELLTGIDGDVVPPVSDSSRVERIVEKALHQAVIKDSISFIFTGFTTAIAGMGGAILGIFSRGDDAGGSAGNL